MRLNAGLITWVWQLGCLDGLQVGHIKTNDASTHTCADGENVELKGRSAMKKSKPTKFKPVYGWAVIYDRSFAEHCSVYKDKWLANLMTDKQFRVVRVKITEVKRAEKIRRNG
jgi:hypothetical protein